MENNAQVTDALQWGYSLANVSEIMTPCLDAAGVKSLLEIGSYAGELTEATRRVLAAGGLMLPPAVTLLWRQRMGVATVLGMLEPRASFRRALANTLGTGKKALR